MKDFNNIKVNGRLWRIEAYLEEAKNKDALADWESDFLSFLEQWTNTESFISVRSSGSTGKAKNIQISKKRMLASAAMTCQFFKLKPEDTALLCLSTKHIGGMMMVLRAIYAGLNLIPREANANPLQHLKEQIDFIAIVPYQAKSILSENPSALENIAHIIIGGGKVDYALQEALKQANVKAFSTFGMTETISHFALQEITKDDSYTCLPGIKIAQSTEGTLIVDAPELLDKAITTNDLIELISAKQFRWLGRKDFAIESGGLKFIPEQIEKRLESKIPERFIITSRSHEQLNNEIILLIEGEQRTLDPKIFEGLSKYEKPKAIVFVPALIEVANGKIDRLTSAQLI